MKPIFDTIKENRPICYRMQYYTSSLSFAEPTLSGLEFLSFDDDSLSYLKSYNWGTESILAVRNIAEKTYAELSK